MGSTDAVGGARNFFYIEVYMKAVYVKENNELKYFIFGMNEKKD